MKFLVTICFAFVVLGAFGQKGVKVGGGVNIGANVNIHDGDNERSLANSYNFYDGVALYSAGNLSGAAYLFSQIAKSDSTYSPAIYYIAKIAYDRSDNGRNTESLQHALTFVNYAISLDSSELDYKLLQGQIYVSMGDYAAAQGVFSYLNSRQSDPQYRRLNAALLLEMGDLAGAIDNCNLYELQYGLDEDVAEIKYLALMRSRRFLDLESYLGRVTDTFTSSARFMVALAEINATLRHDSLAKSNFNRAIALDSTSKDGYLALASYYQYNKDMRSYIDVLTSYFKLKNEDSAPKVALFEREFFNSALYRDHFHAIRGLASALLLSAPDDIAVRLLYGRFLTYIGELDAANEHYQTMYNQGIQDQQVCNRLGEILMYRKDFTAARALFASALLSNPNSFELTVSSIYAQSMGGDNIGAIKMVTSALRAFKSDSTRSVLHSIAGDLYHELGDNGRCYAAYNKALRYDSRNAVVLNNYAYFLALEPRDLERALAMATLACEISMANPTYLDTKAWVLFTMGRYSDALQVQQAALGLDSNKSPELLLHYGDILYANGDDFLARTYWKRALDAGADKVIIEQRMARPRALNSR